MSIDGNGRLLGECVNCKSNDAAPYARENGWNLLQCRVCGFLFVHPRPPAETISAARQIGMHQGAGVIDVRGRFNPAKTARYRCRLAGLFDAPPPCGTWLDVGCGHGEFLTALSRWQPGRWTIVGVEPNAYKREKARRRGFDVRESLNDVRGVASGAISLLNVFSHLPDPPAFLRRLAAMLPPGAELVLQTGNTAGFAARHHPRPLYLPDHLCFASKKIVVGMLQRNGFRVIRTAQFPLIEWTLFELMTEIIKLPLPRVHSRLPLFLHARRYCRADLWVRAQRDWDPPAEPSADRCESSQHPNRILA